MHDDIDNDSFHKCEGLLFALPLLAMALVEMSLIVVIGLAYLLIS